MPYVLRTEMATKMAILYVIDKFEKGVTGEILTEVAVYACGINYFALRQSLFKLEQDGFISSFYNDNSETFVINDRGKEALGFFVKKLPYRFREDIREYIKHLSPEKRPENKFTCDYFPVNDMDYNVLVEYKENGETGLKLEVMAGGKETAMKLAQVINANKDKVYGDIYKYIMELADKDKKD